MRVKAPGCFCRGALSLMFVEILNVTLSEKVSTTGPTHKNLEFPLLPNFRLTPRFYSLEGEIIHWVDKAKTV